MIDRRKLIGAGLGLGVLGPSVAMASVVRGLDGAPATSAEALAEIHDAGRRAAPSRTLAFRNLHTEERLEATYFRDGAYDPDALHAINTVLRDFRTGEVHPIEPRLMDVLFDLQGMVGARTPIQVISGFRSAATNAQLREKSAEVATRSLHMDGRAIDLYLEGVDLAYLRAAAMDLSRGGVGYYPVTGFIHVDVGPVRHWQGT